MRRIDKKVLLIVGLVAVAVCLVSVTIAFYFLHHGRRQRVLLDSAQQYMAEGDHERALLQYKRALGLGNVTADMYYDYAVCLEKLHHPTESLAAFERAADMDDTKVEALRRLIPVYYARARIELADEEADPAASTAAKRFEGAGRAMVRNAPDDPEGYLWLARLHALRGDFDEAIKALDGAAPSLAENESLRAERVVLLLDAGRLDEAEVASRRLLEARPDSVAYNLAHAYVCRKTGRADDEEAALHKCLALDPRSVEAHERLADAYARARRMEEAVTEMKAVCELQPEKSAPWLALAELHRALGRVDEAVECLAKAREMDATNLMPLVQMAQLQIDAGRLEDAAATLKSLEKAKADGAILLWLEGIAELKRDRVAPAREKLLEALRKRSADFPQASFALGQCYTREGNYGAAEEQFVAAGHDAAYRIAARLMLIWTRATNASLRALAVSATASSAV